MEELFSKFGRITSIKVLPSNPNFDGGCAFVNYAEPDSCQKAVESMNNHSIDRFTLRVNHSNVRILRKMPSSIDVFLLFSHEWVEIIMIDHRMDCEWLNGVIVGNFFLFFQVVEIRNQWKEIMNQLHRVLKIDLVVFDQRVHVHRHVPRLRKRMNPIDRCGIVQITNKKQSKVRFRMV